MRIVSARSYRRHAYAVNQKISSRMASLERRSKAAVASHDKAAVTQIHNEIASLKQEARTESKNVDNEVAAQQNALQDSSARSSSKYGELKQSVGSLKETQKSANWAKAFRAWPRCKIKLIYISLFHETCCSLVFFGNVTFLGLRNDR